MPEVKFLTATHLIKKDFMTNHNFKNPKWSHLNRTCVFCLTLILCWQMTFNARAQPCTGVGAGTYSVGPTGTYISVTAALNAINAGITGSIILELQSTYVSNVETFPITFPVNTCIGSVNSLTIRPVTGATALTITSNNVTGTINFNGANYVTIDGRAGGIGVSQLSISNTNVGSSYAVQFTADASFDTLKYCTITSVNTSGASGTIVFGAGTVTGNDGNTITNCTISDGTSNPVNAIYSAGTSAAIDNSGNIISNNNISNYFNAVAVSNGVLLTSTGNSGWTISNNRLFQTSTRLTTSTGITHNGINILSGGGYTISNNTIGFANVAGTGTSNYIGNSVTLSGFPGSYTTTGTAVNMRYIAISCGFTVSGTASEIQGNTIGGFALYCLGGTGASTTSGIWCGINITSGNANIGTTSGNTIGALSGLSSIYTICQRLWSHPLRSLDDGVLEPTLPASTSIMMVGENSRMMESRVTIPTA